MKYLEYEAQFANILEQLKGYRKCSRWFYEPKRFETKDKYIPDFLVYEGDELFLTDWIYLIEYKPSKPTFQYLDYLAKQFDEIHKKDCYEFIDAFYVIYGSCFNDKFERYNYDCKKHTFYEEHDSVNWINQTIIDRAKSHRYDLETTF